jgi:hypothetical protein
MAGALTKIARPLCVALTAGALVVGGALASGPNEQLNPADQRLAYRLILHLRDMPAGWRVEPLSKSSNDCGKFTPAKLNVIVTGKAHSQFSQGQTDIAGSLAAVTRKTKGAKTAYKYLSTAIATCVVDALKKGASDASIGAMSFPRFGDQSSAWNAQATVKQNGFSVGIYFDAVLVRTGRAVALYFFAGVGSGDTYQEVALVRKAVRRA